MVKPIEPSSGLPKVAVVAGIRTPFVKMGTVYKNLSALQLGQEAVRELLIRTALDPKQLDALLYGQVIPSLSGPNIAREVVLGLNMPRNVDAYSVSRACATSTQAVASAAMLIQTGQAKIVVAGGADSASDVPITVSKPLADALVEANSAKTPVNKLKAFSQLAPKDLLPVPPALRELSTGLTMGQSAEKMAKENGISRAEQDAFAHRSHEKATEAWEKGLFKDEVMSVFVPPEYEPVARDNIVRTDSQLEGYAKLRPVFDKKHGTITAANSSPLTDGASATLLMRADVAEALGFEAMAYIKSYAFAALDPSEQMLMGPAYASPRALEAAGLSLSDMDLIDLHEAFAAQILSNVQAFGSKTFAEQKLGRSKAIGEIDDSKFNIYGGSIAIGHPFAATGTRQLNTIAGELKRRGGGKALIAQCAAGGLGAALVIEK